MLVGDSGTGKTLSLACALALCGQEQTGALMKTKATTDSTLPFSLDDPQKMEDIGDLLIGICNGKLTGNLKSGTRRVRSCPLLACNFSVGHVAW